jgi:hypothetical protein
MAARRILDTFSEFTRFWAQAAGLPLDVQLDLWLSDYMSRWPELGEMQIKSYAEDGYDWRAVARERVFPFLGQRLASMAQARQGLLRVIEAADARAREVLGLDFEVFYIIYVGLGCGAGWATTFQGVPACLFGLENIAELGWTGEDALLALAAHEMGHLLHAEWRERRGLAPGQGPWWQLYEEGFAARCQHLILRKDAWHQAIGQEGWLAWCAQHRDWLAAEYLRRVERDKSVAPFFGTWYDLQGWRECGHYLGHELIRAWQGDSSLDEIAAMPGEEVARRARETLAAWPSYDN